MIATRNPHFGFHGTLGEHGPAAWPVAMATIAERTKAPLQAVRAFLDSRLGRHFADHVLGRLQQGQPIEQAVASSADDWMRWSIDRRTSRETGIPQGLPYLTGFVLDHAIADDAL